MKAFIVIVMMLLVVSTAFAESLTLNNKENSYGKTMLLNIDENRLEKAGKKEDGDLLVDYIFLEKSKNALNIMIEKEIRRNFFNEDDDVWRISFEKKQKDIYIVNEIWLTKKGRIEMKKESCGFLKDDCSFYESNVPEKIVILTISSEDAASLANRKLNDKMKFQIASARRISFKANYTKDNLINLYANQYYAKHGIEISKKDVKIKKTTEKIIKDFLIGSF